MTNIPFHIDNIPFKTGIFLAFNRSQCHFRCEGRKRPREEWAEFGVLTPLPGGAAPQTR